MFKCPESLYSTHENLKIEKVVFSDTATVLVCAYEGRIDSKLQWAPTTVLSDKDCQVYPLKQVIWDKESEKMYLSNTKRTDFRLIFAPMPDNTTIFDLIEGTNQGAFCLYGIHDVKTPLKIPTGKEDGEIQEAMDDGSLTGKRISVIRGKIEGYSRDKGYGVATCLYRALEKSEDMPGTCVCIREDGSFDVELFLDHPLWAEISTGANRPLIPFYISPGDTLGITVKGYDEGTMVLEYETTNLGGCHETLLQHNVPVIYSNWEKGGLAALAMTDDAFQSLTETCLNQNDRLCEYMA